MKGSDRMFYKKPDVDDLIFGDEELRISER